MNWEFNDTVQVIKAVRIGTGRDAKVYTTAEAAAVKCAYLRNANYFIRQGKNNLPVADPDGVRQQRLYRKLLPVFKRILK
jgi:hypothetical protein